MEAMQREFCVLFIVLLRIHAVIYYCYYIC